MIESSSLGRCELGLQRGRKLQAQWGRGHLGDQRLPLGQRVMREPLGLEHLLARQHALGIGVKALDEGLARRQCIEARAQPGEDGAGCGPASGGELAQPISPGAQTGHRHTAGCGAHGGRRQTRQDGVFQLPRDAPAGRQEALEGRMMLGRALEPGGGSVGAIVDAGAAQPLFLQHVSRFVPLAAAVLPRGGRSAHLRDEPLESPGNRFARPGIGH